MIHNFYTPLHLWLYARRRGVLVIVALLVVASVIVTARMEMEEDILAMLPQRDRVVDEFMYAVKKFRQVDRLYIDVGIATDNPDALAAAADELYTALAGHTALGRVLYRVESTDQHKLMKYVTGALPVLFTTADEAALAEKLQPAKVRGYLTTMRRKLAGPEGLVLKDIVAADPIGMSGLVGLRLLPLQAGFTGARVEDGRITSADGRHVLLMAEPKFASSNSGASRQLIADVLRATVAVEQHYPSVHVAVTGGHRMAVDNATLIEADSRRCLLIGMAAMGLLCFVSYRRRWLALVTFVPSLVGTALAGVVLVLCYQQLSAIAIGFASIAIGITVDYAIYVVYHLDDAAGLDQRGIGDHVSRLVLPITAGALTTMAAFAVMASSPMRGYQQLGVFGAVGVLFSAAFALLVLPLLVPVPKQNAQPPLWLTRLLERFFAWRARRLSWLLVGLAVVSVAASGGLWRLRFEGDMARMNGVTAATRHDEELIRGTWGDALGLTLVVSRGTTEDAAFAENDRVAERLAGNPDVSAIYSLAAVCPARATQVKNLRRWREFWTDERRAALRTTLREVGSELGFKVDAFSRFWKTVDDVPTWITVETFRDTPLEQVIRERVASAPSDHAVSTMVKLVNRSKADRLRTAVPGVYVLDKQALTEHIAGLAKTGLGWFALWTALLVAIILYISLASVRLTAAALLPLAFGLLWTFGAMGWLGLPVDLMNSVFVVFIIGIGEDYSIFLVTSRLDEWRGRPARLSATSASVVISALTTTFGFAVLILARHPVLFSLGTTVLLGMACAFVATLLLTLLFTDWVLRPLRAPVCSSAPAQEITRLYRYQGRWVERFVMWKMRLDPIFQLLDEATPRHGVILDLGCGYGMASHWLALTGPARTLFGMDYDPDKIRVAQCSARSQPRVRFEVGDILTLEYPACDAVLLLDVLHYWTPAKQQAILAKARAVLRPGGRLVLRDAARADTKAHHRVEWWERLVTRLGHNKTVEGLYFQSAEELTTMLRHAGFTGITVTPTGRDDSNVLVVSVVQ